jgi:hypothetical protein
VIKKGDYRVNKSFILFLIGVLLITASAISMIYSQDYGTVSASALPSCSKHSDADYVYKEVKFKNFCPLCGAHDTLVFNPKNVPEGEWTCSMDKGGCDADYCCHDGWDKGTKDNDPNNPPLLRDHLIVANNSDSDNSLELNELLEINELEDEIKSLDEVIENEIESFNEDLDIVENSFNNIDESLDNLNDKDLEEAINYELSNNSTNDFEEQNQVDNSVDISSFEIFKSDWTNYTSGTKYNYYMGSNQSVQESYDTGIFNCKDGSYLTIMMAEEYNLTAEMYKGELNGYDHRLVKVTCPETNESEFFDTTQMQKYNVQEGDPKVTIGDNVDEEIDEKKPEDLELNREVS